MSTPLNRHPERERLPEAELQRLLDMISPEGWPVLPVALTSYLKASRDVRALPPLIQFWQEKPPKPARRLVRSAIGELIRVNQWLLGIRQPMGCLSCGLHAERADYHTFWLQWYWMRCPRCQDQNHLAWPVHRIEGVVSRSAPRSTDGTLRLQVWDPLARTVTAPWASLDSLYIASDLGDDLDLAATAVINFWAEERKALPPVMLAPGVGLAANTQRLLTAHRR